MPVELPGNETTANTGVPLTMNESLANGNGLYTPKTEKETVLNNPPIADDTPVAVPVGGKKTISSVLASNQSKQTSSVVVTEREKDSNRWWIWLLPLLLFVVFIFLLAQMAGEDNFLSGIFGSDPTPTEENYGNQLPAEDDTATVATIDPAAISNDTATIQPVQTTTTTTQTTTTVEPVEPAATPPPAATTDDGDEGGGTEVIEGLRVTKAKRSDYVPTETNPKGFYIITGSFKSKTNANRLMNQLKGQKLDAHVLQTRNGYYRTGVYVPSGKIADVKKQFSSSQKYHNSDSWVLRYN